MKSKSAIIPIAILSVLGIGIIAFFAWLFGGDITRTLTRLSRFGALTSVEQGCAQRITSDLVYIEKQKDNSTVAIGYFANDDYYVVLFSADAQDHCNIVFQEKAWPLDAFHSVKKDRLIPMAIQMVKLSGNQSPDVYVWFDQNEGRFRGAKHIFFVRQPDNSYKAVLTLELCAGISSVEIMNEQTSPSIMVTDDTMCDWPPSQFQDYIEYSLSSGVPQIIRRWSTGHI